VSLLAGSLLAGKKEEKLARFLEAESPMAEDSAVYFPAEEWRWRLV
jgi:hypothetical protein